MNLYKCVTSSCPAQYLHKHIQPKQRGRKTPIVFTQTVSLQNMLRYTTQQGATKMDLKDLNQDRNHCTDPCPTKTNSIFLPNASGMKVQREKCGLFRLVISSRHLKIDRHKHQHWRFNLKIICQIRSPRASIRCETEVSKFNNYTLLSALIIFLKVSTSTAQLNIGSKYH